MALAQSDYKIPSTYRHTISLLVLLYEFDNVFTLISNTAIKQYVRQLQVFVLYFLFDSLAHSTRTLLDLCKREQNLEQFAQSKDCLQVLIPSSLYCLWINRMGRPFLVNYISYGGILDSKLFEMVFQYLISSCLTSRNILNGFTQSQI